jgi:hypothetical protein
MHRSISISSGLLKFYHVDAIIFGVGSDKQNENPLSAETNERNYSAAFFTALERIALAEILQRFRILICTTARRLVKPPRKVVRQTPRATDMAASS